MENELDKMTAVQWLIHNIVEDQTIKAKSMSEWIDIFKQAKEMEKQQIINAVDGFPLNNRNLEGEQYYAETYGKKTFLDLVSDEESKVHEVVRKLKEKRIK